MKPLEWWEKSDPDLRAGVALRVGITVQYLGMICHDQRVPGAPLALELEDAVAGEVCRHEWRPDYYRPVEGDITVCPDMCIAKQRRARAVMEREEGK